MVLGVVIVCCVGAIAWFFATPPQPRTTTAGWILGPELAAARGELASAVGYATPCTSPPCPNAERLYVLGGLSGLLKPLNAVTIYDPHQRRWTVGPSLPAPRHHFAAARLGQDVYASGGTDVAGIALGHHHWPPMNNFWRLRPGAERWEPLAPMLEPRWGHRMVVHDGQLYIVGGRGPSAHVLVWSPTQGWRTGAEMPRMRDHLSVVVADGRIWAVGGRDPQSLKRVDIYDPSADRWHSGPDLPHATSGAAEAIVDGVIFLFGGEEPAFVGGGIVDQHWRLNTRTPAPRWEPTPAPPLAVHGGHAVLLHDTIAIAGGASRHGALSVAGWTRALQLFPVRL